MEALLVSTGIVALAEIGDKTQLLSLVLATRFRRPIPIVLGILAATLFNHALAAAAGNWAQAALGAFVLRWILGLSFLAMAIWALVPDAPQEANVEPGRFGVFGTTLISFFLVEMGDKTQVATLALAAQHAAFTSVVIGTTAGMMLANVPVVLLGERIARRLPMRAIRAIAAAVFAVLGAAVLLELRGAG
ncbi:MAG: TMEM165/GDT1 family protein [Pseudomonadota bacterium]